MKSEEINPIVETLILLAERFWWFIVAAFIARSLIAIAKKKSKLDGH